MEFWVLLCFWSLVATGSQNGVSAGQVDLKRAPHFVALEEPAPSVCYFYTYTWLATEGAPFATPLYPSWAEPGSSPTGIPPQGIPPQGNPPYGSTSALGPGQGTVPTTSVPGAGPSPSTVTPAGSAIMIPVAQGRDFSINLNAYLSSASDDVLSLTTQPNEAFVHLNTAQKTVYGTAPEVASELTVAITVLVAPATNAAYGALRRVVDMKAAAYSINITLQIEPITSVPITPGNSFSIKLNRYLENPSDTASLVTQPSSSWITYDASTKVVSGTVPSTYAAADTNLTINAVTQNGTTYSRYFMLDVQPVPSIPQTTGKTFLIRLREYLLATSDNITSVTLDPTASWITYSSSAGTLSGTVPTSLTNGTVVVTVRAASDSKGFSYSFQLKIVVQDVTQASAVLIPVVASNNFAINVTQYFPASSQLTAVSSNPAVTWVKFDATQNRIYGSVPDLTTGNVVTITVNASSTGSSAKRSSVQYSKSFSLEINANDIPAFNITLGNQFSLDLSEDLLSQPGDYLTGITTNPTVSWLSLSSDGKRVTGTVPNTVAAGTSITINGSAVDPTLGSSYGKQYSLVLAAGQNVTVPVILGEAFQVNLTQYLETNGDTILPLTISPDVSWVSLHTAQPPYLFGTVPTAYDGSMVNITVSAVSQVTGYTYTILVILDIFGEATVVPFGQSAEFVMSLVPLLKTPLDLVESIQTYPSVDWITFNMANRSISGRVPDSEPAGSINITVDALSTDASAAYTRFFSKIISPRQVVYYRYSVLVSLVVPSQAANTTSSSTSSSVISTTTVTTQTSQTTPISTTAPVSSTVPVSSTAPASSTSWGLKLGKCTSSDHHQWREFFIAGIDHQFDYRYTKYIGVQWNCCHFVYGISRLHRCGKHQSAKYVQLRRCCHFVFHLVQQQSEWNEHQFTTKYTKLWWRCHLVYGTFQHPRRSEQHIPSGTSSSSPNTSSSVASSTVSSSNLGGVSSSTSMSTSQRLASTTAGSTSGASTVSSASTPQILSFSSATSTSSLAQSSTSSFSSTLASSQSGSTSAGQTSTSSQSAVTSGGQTSSSSQSGAASAGQTSTSSPLGTTSVGQPSSTSQAATTSGAQTSTSSHSVTTSGAQQSTSSQPGSTSGGQVSPSSQAAATSGSQTTFSSQPGSTSGSQRSSSPSISTSGGQASSSTSSQPPTSQAPVSTSSLASSSASTTSTAQSASSPSNSPTSSSAASASSTPSATSAQAASSSGAPSPTPSQSGSQGGSVTSSGQAATSSSQSQRTSSTGGSSTSVSIASQATTSALSSQPSTQGGSVATSGQATSSSSLGQSTSTGASLTTGSSVSQSGPSAFSSQSSTQGGSVTTSSQALPSSSQSQTSSSGASSPSASSVSQAGTSAPPSQPSTQGGSVTTSSQSTLSSSQSQMTSIGTSSSQQSSQGGIVTTTGPSAAIRNLGISISAKYPRQFGDDDQCKRSNLISEPGDELGGIKFIPKPGNEPYYFECLSKPSNYFDIWQPDFASRNLDIFKHLKLDIITELRKSNLFSSGNLYFKLCELNVATSIAVWKSNFVPSRSLYIFFKFWESNTFVTNFNIWEPDYCSSHLPDNTRFFPSHDICLWNSIIWDI
ncbi:hypothetical protein VP1G_03477 [Cytospora mali]|uniref:Uncharacterized protein n=1 Tax=Cytospora mali TaxID=578113 RepID=A0A194UX03_CYTMA|nr:hypothetical protein VP1G_03477 [Valsa mali var. pyri (nom. inval.)]